MGFQLEQASSLEASGIPEAPTYGDEFGQDQEGVASEESGETRGCAEAFRSLWAPIFKQVDSIDSLNRVLRNCCVD